MSKNNDIAIFGDLTALYACRSRLRRNINYKELDEKLKSHFGVNEFETNLWFTLFDQNNEKQESFITKTLEPLGWEVNKITIQEVNVPRDARNYRFDSRISWELGLATGSEYSDIVVISDSFELFSSLQRIKNEDKGVKLHIAYFSSALDLRWNKEITDGKIVNFISLD